MLLAFLASSLYNVSSINGRVKIAGTCLMKEEDLSVSHFFPIILLLPCILTRIVFQSARFAVFWFLLSVFYYLIIYADCRAHTFVCFTSNQVRSIFGMIFNFCISLHSLTFIVFLHHHVSLSSVLLSLPKVPLSRWQHFFFLFAQWARLVSMLLSPLRPSRSLPLPFTPLWISISLSPLFSLSFSARWSFLQFCCTCFINRT